MADHAELLPIAREAVAMARVIIRSRAPRSVMAKGDRDLVTDIDLAVEDAVRAFLRRETPEIGVLGEEHGRTGGDDGLWWALDPVDGTSNFARGVPLCAVSLGLVDGRRGVLAAIDLPFLDAVYTAADGQGAFMDDEPIGVSGVSELSDAVISVGDFAVGGSAAAEAKNRVRLALLDDLGARAQRVRMIGTAAIDLAWVAQGRFDATVILSNQPWDTAAGVLLVREAGGVVVDHDGGDHTTDSAATIALTPGLRGAVMTSLGSAYAAA